MKLHGEQYHYNAMAAFSDKMFMMLISGTRVRQPILFPLVKVSLYIVQRIWFLYKFMEILHFVLPMIIRCDSET